MRNVEITKKCKACGKVFITIWPRKTYCSDECRQGKEICIRCNKVFIRKKGTTGRYCSQKCWYGHYQEIGKNAKECPNCGKIFHGPTKTCSRECSFAYRRKQHPLRRETCEQCGVPLEKKRPHIRFCSIRCSMLNRSACNVDGKVRPEGYKKILNGYIQVKHNGKWVFEHRLVMEQILGRPLEKHERVHHKNGRRGENGPENLELWKIKKRDPAGIRQADYHCPGCRCFEK